MTLRIAPLNRLPALPRICSLLLTALAGVLTGCTAGPGFVRPAAHVPAHWASRAVAAAAPQGTPRRESRVSERSASLQTWWRGFHDPTLTRLLGEAVDANLDLRTAVLHVEEAQVQQELAADSYWPTLSANASYSLQRLSTTMPTGALLTSFTGKAAPLPGLSFPHISNPYSQYQLGGELSWELDLFGRVRREVEAAKANVQVSVADRNSMLVALLADVAHGYIGLRGAQARKAIAEASLKTQNQLLELTRQRQAAGLTSDLDVQDAAAEVATTRSQIPVLDAQITSAINALSELLGRDPGALRARLLGARPVPPVPPQVPVGLPADLVRRRPDIRAAEASLHAATAQIGVAVASLFPNLTLGGGGGFQSLTVSRLLRWASLFSAVGPTLVLPVFDRGLHANVRLQDLRAKEAAVAYARTVLVALQQVDDALAAYGAQQDQRSWLQRAVVHNRSALSLARQRYRSGIASFINVLDAERTLQQNQMALASSTTAVSSDLVELYRALGGGWQQPPRALSLTTKPAGRIPALRTAGTAPADPGR